MTALVDTSGAVVERYLYDPYGKVTVCNGSWTPREGNASAYSNEILFTGHRLDPESGLYITLHRHYHPTLGRWMQRDPQGYVDGMGLYEYVGGRPGSCVDPQGLKYQINGPKRSDYRTGNTQKDNDAFVRDSRVARAVERTIRYAGTEIDAIKKELVQARMKGDDKRAVALEKQRAALELIKWTADTKDVTIAVNFQPTIKDGLRGQCDMKPMREGKGEATITMAGQNATSVQDVASVFFHETLHAFYGGISYGVFKQGSLPDAVRPLIDFVGTYTIEGAFKGGLDRPGGLTSEQIKFGQGLGKLMGQANGKYKPGGPLPFEKEPYERTGGFEAVVTDAERQFASPAFLRPGFSPNVNEPL